MTLSAATSADLKSELTAALNVAILEALPPEHANKDLHHFYTLIRDYPRRGGKRLRGLLTLLSTGAHGGDWRQAVPIAAALELFQNWVLIHDDIEDGSLERRGRPALHQLCGAAVAINVGDALHGYMWRLLVEQVAATPMGPNVLREFVHIVDRTAQGQHLDLSWIDQGRFDVSESEYLDMVTLKTAYYTVVAPLKLGAIASGVSPDPLLEEAGVALGIAFQVRDDVLNLEPGEGYGKEPAGDLLEAKRTLILAHLFEHADPRVRRELAKRLRKTREHKAVEDVDMVLREINRSGSLEHAQRVAERHAKTGIRLLEKVSVDLPGTSFVAQLMDLLGGAAARTK